MADETRYPQVDGHDIDIIAEAYGRATDEDGAFRRALESAWRCGKVAGDKLCARCGVEILSSVAADEQILGKGSIPTSSTHDARTVHLSHRQRGAVCGAEEMIQYGSDRPANVNCLACLRLAAEPTEGGRDGG